MKTKVKHKHPLLSMCKVYTDEELLDFPMIRDGVQHHWQVSPKIDGIAISLEYQKGRFVQALTRGNGLEGTDITSLIKKVPFIPQLFEYESDFIVHGELYVNKEDLCSDYKTCRHMVTATVNSKPEKILDNHIKVLKFHKYATYGDCPDTWPTIKENAAVQIPTDKLWYSVGYMLESRHGLSCPTDGVVVSVISDEVRRLLGHTKSHYKWAIAIKELEHVTQSIVTDIKQSVSKLGKVTHIADIEPVILNNVCIKKVNIHNNSKAIKPGDEVIVSLTGGCIPDVIGIVGGETWIG
jgi:DNA ligase (NAD+)